MYRKIALIFIGNIEYCPYLKAYERILNSANIVYDVLFWKREKFPVRYPDNYKYFKLETKLTKQKAKKIFDFCCYSFWLRKQLKKGKYTKLIYLETLTGMLVYLSKSNRNKVPAILEIRDYSYEKIKLFRILEKRMILNMDKVFISSRAFRNFLPEGHYIVTHNLDYNECQQECLRRRFVKKSKQDSLNVVYVGSVRFFKYQCAIIDELKNDGKFNIFYHGTGPDYERLRKYCMDNKIWNVEFTGFYRDYEKPNFYEKADLLINCYDVVSRGYAISYAISNKYYDGLIYHVPQLSENHTFKGELVQKNGIGITWGPAEGNLRDKLLDFYYGIDEKLFNERCHGLIETYIQEYEEYTDAIKTFIEN